MKGEWECVPPARLAEGKAL